MVSQKNEKLVMNSHSWHVLRFILSVKQPDSLKSHIVIKIPTEKSYFERPVFSKSVQQQSEWDFELDVRIALYTKLYKL